MLSPPLVESKHALKDLRELCVLCERKKYSLWEKDFPNGSTYLSILSRGQFSFSQSYTEEQNTQAHRRWWPLPLPLPRREGEWSPRYPYKEDVRLVLLSYWLSCRGNLTYYAPPCGGGVGGGATILWAQTVRQKPPWTLCALWEKNISSVRGKAPNDLNKHPPHE